jgi:hypothetical protein
MPFDEEEESQEVALKTGLKNVSSQKSIFDAIPKRQTQEDFTKKVNNVQEQVSSHKSRAAELSSHYNKIMADKTLKQNKNIFAKDMERELLTKMAQLAIDVNNDQHEHEGMGSLSWIVLLLKTCLNQRDKINQLEFFVSQLEKKLDPAAISKEIQAVLDKKKVSE